MKKSAYLLLAAFGSLALLASCGTQPQNLDTLQSAIKKDKSDKKDKSGKKGKKNKKTMWEPFESYETDASAPASYIWVKNGASETNVSNIDPANGIKNLKIHIKEDSAARDFIGVKFCLDAGASDILAASFNIKLKNLVNWTGLGIIGDQDNMQYWWWIRQDGTVFNGHTFDSFMENTWHQVTITIDRTMSMATFDLDGNQNHFDLNFDWITTDPTQPMQCMFVFLGVYDTPQTVQIDDVAILGY